MDSNSSIVYCNRRELEKQRRKIHLIKVYVVTRIEDIVAVTGVAVTWWTGTGEAEEENSFNGGVGFILGSILCCNRIDASG